jgi:hypothetical protein
MTTTSKEHENDVYKMKPSATSFFRLPGALLSSLSASRLSPFAAFDNEMTTRLSNYAIAFLLTISVEVAVALILGYRKRREIACIVWVNVFSHPLLNLIVWILRASRPVPARDPVILLLEAGVVVLEWLLLCYALPRNPKGSLLVLSAAMNIASYGAGLVLPIWIS